MRGPLPRGLPAEACAEASVTVPPIPLGFPKRSESPTYCYDLHATALHLLGIDHTRLTFYHNGIQRRLTDVHGHVIQDIIS